MIECCGDCPFLDGRHEPIGHCTWLNIWRSPDAIPCGCERDGLDAWLSDLGVAQ